MGVSAPAWLLTRLLTPVPENLSPSSGLSRHQALKQNVNTYKINSNTVTLSLVTFYQVAYITTDSGLLAFTTSFIPVSITKTIYFTHREWLQKVSRGLNRFQRRQEQKAGLYAK